VPIFRWGLHRVPISESWNCQLIWDRTPGTGLAFPFCCWVTHGATTNLGGVSALNGEIGGLAGQPGGRLGDFVLPPGEKVWQDLPGKAAHRTMGEAVVFCKPCLNSSSTKLEGHDLAAETAFPQPRTNAGRQLAAGLQAFQLLPLKQLSKDVC